ncbi:hypothetical protein DASB73_018040 [Starmerella bacillaris]|uniref:Apple domain-containing protein n=1 Tax=Starmerella bacillaris TaxID=1247836 RepID=A0AAV5RJN7_STABA|nr:hypothetical protein DASB73_018040 [Starmerella bacillaris]
MNNGNEKPYRQKTWRTMFHLVSALFVIICSTSVVMIHFMQKKNEITFNDMNELAATGTNQKSYMDDPSLALSNPSNFDDARSVADKSYLVMKTGASTMTERITAHKNTTFKWFPFFSVYGDYDTEILGIEIVNTLGYYSADVMNRKELEIYKARQISLVDHWGWFSEDLVVPEPKLSPKIRRQNARRPIKYASAQLSKFKTIPALGHAWSQDNSKDWYVLLNDNVIFLPSVLAAATAGKNPKDILLLGKNVGMEYNVLSENSAIILSRGAMSTLFGFTAQSISDEVNESFEAAQQSKIGDGIIENRLKSKTSKNFMKFADIHNGIGLFQGNFISATVCHATNWCSPVGVLTFISVWELKEMAAWYDNLMRLGGFKYIPLYYDLYRDFILPHAVYEISSWQVNYDNVDGSIAPSVRKDGKSLAAKSVQNCRDECENDPSCLMYAYREGTICELFLDAVISGYAYNDHILGCSKSNSIVGYITSRIVGLRADAVCDPLIIDENIDTSKSEGWHFRELVTDSSKKN